MHIEVVGGKSGFWLLLMNVRQWKSDDPRSSGIAEDRFAHSMLYQLSLSLKSVRLSNWLQWLLWDLRQTFFGIQYLHETLHLNE